MVLLPLSHAGYQIVSTDHVTVISSLILFFHRLILNTSGVFLVHVETCSHESLIFVTWLVIWEKEALVLFKWVRRHSQVTVLFCYPLLLTRSIWHRVYISLRGSLLTIPGQILSLQNVDWSRVLTFSYDKWFSFCRSMIIAISFCVSVSELCLTTAPSMFGLSYSIL